MKFNSGKRAFTQQPDAYLSQNNPVSNVIYPVLPLSQNVRILSACVTITWGVTQPTPLELLVTIDGLLYDFYVANPVTATDYIAVLNPTAAINAQYGRVSAAVDWVAMKAFLLEGRSVQVDARITWAVTQPSPLVCLVRWAML